VAGSNPASPTIHFEIIMSFPHQFPQSASPEVRLSYLVSANFTPPELLEKSEQLSYEEQYDARNHRASTDEVRLLAQSTACDDLQRKLVSALTPAQCTGACKTAVTVEVLAAFCERRKVGDFISPDNLGLKKEDGGIFSTDTTVVRPYELNAFSEYLLQSIKRLTASGRPNSQSALQTVVSSKVEYSAFVRNSGIWAHNIRTLYGGNSLREFHSRSLPSILKLLGFSYTSDTTESALSRLKAIDSTL
jgi:hypothetical protein